MMLPLFLLSILSPVSPVCDVSNLFETKSKDLIVEGLSQCEELRILSELPWWRSINGWSTQDRESGKSEITSEKAFNSKRGSESAHEDFLGFLADLALAKQGDQKLSCRFPTKIRFLKKSLSLLSPELFKSFERQLQKLSLCEFFEKWARVETIDHLEVILASASTASPASLFGHLFVRVVYDQKKSSVGPGLMPIFQFAVTDEDFQSQGDYQRLWSGITGNFEAELFERPAYIVERHQLVKLRRNFRRFEIRLSSEKIRDVMERIWEGIHLEKAYHYYFFTHNCAALFVDFLRPALLPEIATQKSWQLVVPPGREIKNLMEDGLLVPLPPDSPSRLDSIRFRLSEREELFNQVSKDEDLNSTEALQRLAAYRRLKVSSVDDFQFLIHSIHFEEYDSDLRRDFSNDLDETFDGLLGIYAKAERSNPTFAKVALDQTEEQTKQNIEKRARLESFRQKSAGYWNLTAGYKFASEFDSEKSHHHLLSLRSGFLNEPLGTHSWFGSHSSGEIMALYGTFDIEPTGSEKLPMLDFTILSYLNLKRSLPIIDSNLKRFSGWSVDLKIKRNAFLDRRLDVIPQASFVANLYDSDDYSDYIIGSLGLSLPVDLSLSGDGSVLNAGVPFGLRAKKQLFRMPAISLTADYSFSPLFDLQQISYRSALMTSLQYQIWGKNYSEGFLEMNLSHEVRKAEEWNQIFSTFVGVKWAN